jgi:predicted GTPase
VVSDQRRVLICGAAGRDYHNFNRLYRENPGARVVAFTATQIPGIADRSYPATLAGPLYPEGIPIVAEQNLETLIKEHSVDEVAFAYSDISHGEVMHVASRVLAAGANFVIHGPEATMVAAEHPVIAVSAVRTGCGKSQIARYLSRCLRDRSLRVAAIRHPMPYGDLPRQAVQRFASMADIQAADCTLEEREEYEPHVAAGNVVFAGVDYAAITRAADAEADVIVWDGGNNDFPFLAPDFHIVVVDALRPTHLTTHHPGEAVLRMADLVIVNKVDAAEPVVVDALTLAIEAIVPGVPILLADSPVRLDAPIERKTKILIVEDGPTITHGGMATGAGFQAVKDLDLEIVDPRRSAVPEILSVYERFPHIGPVLPAMGYSPAQREALRETIDRSIADVVVSGTPIDLARDVGIGKPVVRARYNYQDHGAMRLMDVIGDRFRHF